MSLKFGPRLLATTVIAGLAVGALTLPAAAQVDNPPPEWTINTSGWRGGAFEQPDTGNFSHCGIGRPYENGVTTIFSMNRRYELTLGMLNEDFSFTANTQPFEATLSIDDTFEQVYPAVPAGEQVLAVPLGTDGTIIQQLREGVQLTVRLPVTSFRFPLNGTFNSFAALRDCVDAANEILPPLPEEPEPASQPDAPQGDQPAQRDSMGSEALQALLGAAGLEDVSMVPDEQIPEDALQLDHAWTVGPLVGGVHQTARSSRDIQINAFMRGYVSIVGQRCEGELDAQVEDPVILLSRYALGAAEITCTTEDATSVMALAFVLDDNFYSAFLHESDQENADMAREATGRILRLVRDLATTGAQQGQGQGQGQGQPDGAGEAPAGDAPAAEPTAEPTAEEDPAEQPDGADTEEEPTPDTAN